MKKYLADAANLINNAQKPFIVWGQGAILGNAENEFLNFINKSGIPAAWTILGLSAGIYRSSTLNVGMWACMVIMDWLKLTNECDLLIAIGMRF